MTTRHYDKDQVVLIAMGIPVLEYAEGDSLSVTYSEDDWVVKQGHHGSVMRAKKPNSVAELTLKLMQGSPANELLSAKVALDLRTGLGAAPSSIKDTNGTSLMSCDSSWCVKRPDLGLATEPGDVEWKFACSGAEIWLGQNRLI
jgi:hypothetical protein